MCHLEQDIRSPSETPPVPAPHHHAIPPLHQEPSLPSWNLKMVKVESCSCLLRMGGRPSAISKANQRYQPHTMAMQYHDEEGREYLKKMFGDIVAAYFWGCSSLWWWSNQQAPKKKCFADAIPFPISLHFFQDGYALAAAMQKLRAKLRNTMTASIKTWTKQCDASVFGFNLLWQRNVQYNNISMMELYDKAAGK